MSAFYNWLVTQARKAGPDGAVSLDEAFRAGMSMAAEMMQERACEVAKYDSLSAEELMEFSKAILKARDGV